MKSGGQSFLGGAFILMISSLSVRIIGAFFKIPLSAMIGGEGMGYYMTAYTVMGPAFAISTMGFSMAVSKLCSAASSHSRREDRNEIISSALILFTLMGMSLAIIIYTLSPELLKLLGNEAATKAVRSMVPAILFCCISSAFRGYFEGIGNMLPTALSQFIGAVTKLICGLLFSKLCIAKAVEEFEQYGTVMGEAVNNMTEAMSIAAPSAAAAAVSGVSVSTAVGCLVSALIFIKTEQLKRKTTDKPVRFTYISSQLIKNALPISAAALVINLATIVDTISVINRLNKAVETNWKLLCLSRPELLMANIGPERSANFLYGSYTGLAMTVFNLAPAFSASIGVCALPMISSLYARGNSITLKKRVESILRITFIVAIPIGFGMCTMAEPIMNVLFSSNVYEADIASDLLKVLGIASIFVAVSGVVNSILQAVGRIYVPLKLLIIGSTVKLIINWVLIAVPQINISAAPYGTLFCYLFIMGAGMAVLFDSVKSNINLLSIIIKPIASAVFCCYSAKTAIKFMENIIFYPAATAISIIIGALVYVLFLVILKGFDQSELELLGNNSKLNKLVYFYRLFPCKSHCDAVK